MVENIEENNINENSEPEEESNLVSWEVPEHNVYERGRSWYIIFSLIVGALLLYGFLTANFLLAVIAIIASLVILLHDSQEVPQIKFSITDEGIYLGKKFHDFDEFEQFAIIYKPNQDIKNLYLDFKNKLKPMLSIPLENKNPVYIRNILSEYLEEDTERTDPPFSEEFSKLFKI
ncbi:MAG: hypothetical protein ACOCVY_02720 [Patescibacteria group bacterium]